MTDTELQPTNSKVPPQLQAHVYKKGQSGNPGGKPVGAVSMKTYVKNKLLAMSPEDREEFLEGIEKKVLWEMSEAKAKQDIDADVKATINVIIPKQIAEAFNINEPNTETIGGDTKQE